MFAEQCHTAHVKASESTEQQLSMLSLNVVAARLGVSVATTRRLVTDGSLSAHRVRGQIRVAAADLHSYLDATRLPTSEPDDARVRAEVES
jgi:excisionase family DNA binding protein